MKISSSQQESITQLLTRIYIDIRELEEHFQLRVGGYDFRPRIEYFHDAIRVFSAQEEGSRESGGRLCVELLAYDLSCLRYIQASPLAPFTPYGAMLSPRTDMLEGKNALAVRPPRPDRAARERISELYQTYAVLFAALLKPFVDLDYNGRIEDLNEDVRELSEAMHHLEDLKTGKISMDQAMIAIQSLEEDGLRQLLQMFVHQRKYRKASDFKKLKQAIKRYMAQKDKEVAAIEAAHMNFVLAQLAIFEESKDLLKKMAAQGMNLIGRFVQDAMAQARKEMGR